LTVCVKDRRELLGRVIVGRDALGAPIVELSEYGEFIYEEIEKTPIYYNGVTAKKFVVMPNHIHMILMVARDGAPRASREGAPRASRPTTALIPTIVTALKKKTKTKFGLDIWQTSYHDHIIRNEEEYQKIWKYIDENPSKWEEDEYYKNT